jgi:hypothetical protein
MAADSTGKVKSGDPFKPPPAVIWNGMIDAGQAFAAQQFSSSAPGATRTRATDLLKLKNSSEAVRRKGEILKIEGKVLETITDEHIWLDGIEPTTDCRFGILKEPADDGEVVTVQVSGVCMALVNITDEEHTFAGAVDEEYVLQSDGSGPLEILWAPSGTGEKDCVVRFGVASTAQAYMVTTLNCALDGFDIQVATLLDEDSRHYVECKPVTIPSNGTVDDEADPIPLYCDTATRGFLVNGLVVMAERVKGRLTTRHGIEIAHGLYVGDSLGGVTITLFADGDGSEDAEVEIDAVNACGAESTEGPGTVDTVAKVDWEWRPGDNGGAARLVLADWCCPP